MAGRLGHTVVALVTVVACFGLVGCATSVMPEPESRITASTPNGSTASPSSSGDPGASGDPSSAPSSEPQLDPSGTARDNLAYFNRVNKTYLTANPSAGGRAIIDNLVAAGFGKSAMQVTPDKTVYGHPADSIQFSVLMGEDCLVGQSSGGTYGGFIGPVLSTGNCLIGKTRLIDW